MSRPGGQGGGVGGAGAGGAGTRGRARAPMRPPRGRWARGGCGGGGGGRPHLPPGEGRPPLPPLASPTATRPPAAATGSPPPPPRFSPPRVSPRWLPPAATPRAAQAPAARRPRASKASPPSVVSDSVTRQGARGRGLASGDPSAETPRRGGRSRVGPAGRGEGRRACHGGGGLPAADARPCRARARGPSGDRRISGPGNLRGHKISYIIALRIWTAVCQLIKFTKA